MAKPPEDETFFSRWSKRKRTSETEPATPEVDPPAPAPEVVPDAVESLSEEEIAALPPVDMFTIETDIRPFLQKGVPQALRNAALRRKWMLTPSIRDHADPAVDYAWDWNTPGGVPGDGLGPSLEKGAQMLREFTAPRCDAASDNMPVAEEKPAPKAVAQADHSAVRHAQRERVKTAEKSDAAADLQDQADAENYKENQSDIEEAPQRRRHGSALPD